MSTTNNNNNSIYCIFILVHITVEVVMCEHVILCVSSVWYISIRTYNSWHIWMMKIRLCSFSALCRQKSRNASHFNDLFSNSVIIIVCSRLHQNSINKGHMQFPKCDAIECSCCKQRSSKMVKVGMEQIDTVFVGSNTLNLHLSNVPLHKIDAFISLGRAVVSYFIQQSNFRYRLFSILNSACYCFHF